MKQYTIKQLAELAKISVRTLHYYDQINLLKPGGRRDNNNYRYYSQAELYRLQQILFYKELDLPLAEIKKILDNPQFDQVKALQKHAQQIKNKIERLKKLETTITKTINKFNHNHTMTDQEIYEGFDPEQAKAYRAEAAERWGEDKVQASEQKIKKMGREQFAKVKAEGHELTESLASALRDRQDPGSAEVQELIKRYQQHLSNFYEVTKEIYLNLGKMYVDDPRFTAHYNKYEPDLAEFIYEAIKIYCSWSPSRACTTLYINSTNWPRVSSWPAWKYSLSSSSFSADQAA